MTWYIDKNPFFSSLLKDTFHKNELINYNNLYYTSKIYMGSEMQGINVIWDTGSDWFLVETDTCTNCKSPYFHQTESTSFSYFQPDEFHKQQYADGSYVNGQAATDKLCVTQDPASCTLGFKFLAVFYQNGFSASYDGILGMKSGANGNTDPLFVPHLYSQGLIAKNEFAFYTTGENGKSFFDLGAPNLSIMRDPSKLVWLACDPTWSKWVNSIKGFRWDLGPDSENQLFSFDPLPALTDTGGSCLRRPKK